MHFRYVPPAERVMTRTTRGKSIVLLVLAFMLFSWLWNLRVAVVRDRLSIGLGLQFVICLWIMIWLWRGASWARWITFAIYAFFGLWLLAYAASTASAYFAVCAAILCVLSLALAMPSVGTFQREQRRGGTLPADAVDRAGG
jgi:hypothetical protein